MYSQKKKLHKLHLNHPSPLPARGVDREEQRLVEQQRAFEDEQRFMELMLPLPINAANTAGAGACT